jgi:hypothetical protein
MGSIDKGFSLLLVVILAVSSLILVGSAYAQSAPTPSKPEFTAQFVDRSYDVPKTTWTTTDPFNGQQVTRSSGGNHITNRTIDFTITNQPFTPIALNNGKTVQIYNSILLYYSIQSKGHFEEWVELNGGERIYKLVPASTSQFTTITVVLDPTNPPYYDISGKGQEDFRVKAIAGYYNQGDDFMAPATFMNLTESDWSNTQTLTIPESFTYTSPTPNPTSPTTSTSQNPTPTVPEISMLVFLPFLLLMLSVAVLSRLRRKRYDVDG